MQFRPVFMLLAQPFFSRELAAEVDDFNDSAAQHQRGVDAYLQRVVAGKQAIDPLAVDFKKLESGKERMSRVELLQYELRLRRQWAELYARAREESATQVTALYDNVQAVWARTAKGLESLGYLPLPENKIPVAGSWVPDFILRHNDYREAKATHESLHAAMNDWSQHTANAERMEQIEAELEQLRCRALGIPPAAGAAVA